MKRFLLLLLASCAQAVLAHTNQDCQLGLSRIIPGWTNYSTAFNATHDLGADGEFATVAGFYVPPFDVRPLEYGVVVIWNGPRNQSLNFAAFDFRIFFWGSEEAFRLEPRLGDLATLAYAAPATGATNADTTTVGGRPAYHLRFSLTNSTLTFTQCHTYLVGFAARSRVQQDGELFVPTGPSDGPSDATAGSLVPMGFIYLINAGGTTIYSGQLATDLCVEPIAKEPPALLVQPSGDGLQLSWPAGASCYNLEASDELGPNADWSPVTESITQTESNCIILLPAVDASRFFRLAK